MDLDTLACGGPPDAMPILPRSRTFRQQVAKWAVNHLDRRFKGILEDDANLKATALYPSVKLEWLDGAHEKDRLTAALIDDLKHLINVSPSHTVVGDGEGDVELGDDGAGAEDDIEDYMHRFVNKSTGGSAPRQQSTVAGRRQLRIQQATAALRNFLSTGVVKLSRGTPVTPAHFPHVDVALLFAKLNTPMPSSAAVERLFSQGRRITHYLRGSLSDASVDACLIASVNPKSLPEND